MSESAAYLLCPDCDAPLRGRHARHREPGCASCRADGIAPRRGTEWRSVGMAAGAFLLVMLVVNVGATWMTSVAVGRAKDAMPPVAKPVDVPEFKPPPFFDPRPRAPEPERPKIPVRLPDDDDDRNRPRPPPRGVPPHPPRFGERGVSAP